MFTNACSKYNRSIPNIPYDRQAFEEMIEEFPEDTQTKLYENVNNIEKQITIVNDYNKSIDIRHKALLRIEENAMNMFENSKDNGCNRILLSEDSKMDDHKTIYLKHLSKSNEMIAYWYENHVFISHKLFSSCGYIPKYVNEILTLMKDGEINQSSNMKSFCRIASLFGYHPSGTNGRYYLAYAFPEIIEEWIAPTKAAMEKTNSYNPHTLFKVAVSGAITTAIVVGISLASARFT
jgi:hypothetical protein